MEIFKGARGEEGDTDLGLAEDFLKKKSGPQGKGKSVCFQKATLRLKRKRAVIRGKDSGVLRDKEKKKFVKCVGKKGTGKKGLG